MEPVCLKADQEQLLLPAHARNAEEQENVRTQNNNYTLAVIAPCVALDIRLLYWRLPSRSASRNFIQTIWVDMMSNSHTTKKISDKAFEYVRSCENWHAEMLERRHYNWPRRAVLAAERQTERYRIKAIKALGGRA